MGREGEERREVNYSLSRLLLLLPSVSVSLVMVVVVLFLSLSDSGAFFGIPVSLQAAVFFPFFLIFFLLTYRMHVVFTYFLGDFFFTGLMTDAQAQHTVL